MTDSTTPTIPAGWYPNPDGSGTLRWWNGSAWTDDVQQPYSTSASATSLKAPEGTPVYTIWIWLMLGVSALSTFSVLLLDPRQIVPELDINDPNAARAAQLAMMTSPAYLVQSLSSWVVAAAIVVFAVLDWRQLKINGVPRPFHWAFAFLGYVYPIGRAVVTNRRAGRGLIILWLAIGVIVLSIVVSLAWSAVFVSTIMGSIPR